MLSEINIANQNFDGGRILSRDLFAAMKEKPQVGALTNIKDQNYDLEVQREVGVNPNEKSQKIDVFA